MLRKERLPFLLFAILSLIAGLLAGLQRIGWTFYTNAAGPNHGAIMVGGFLGTLITLEKIIPLKRNSLFLIPLVSASSVVLFLAGMQILALWFLLPASLGLGIVFLVYWTRERTLSYFLMFVGAVCWLTGNILLLKTGFYPVSIPWWMAFVLFIITAERLELIKFLPVSINQKKIFIGLLMFFLTGCFISFHGIGRYFAAAGLATSSIWLMRHDIVEINRKKEGLARYSGIALLSGYFTLLLCGIFLPILTERPLGYDVIVHSFFIGFVFSMIFGHGPIILPGVLGVSAKPYHPILYVWLIMLHGSWIVRLFADTTLDMSLRKYSGMASAIAIVGYFFSIAIITMQRRREKTI